MTKLQEKKQRRHPRRETLAIEEFIPPYLNRFITPYHGDFCFTRIYHPRLVAQLMSEGFLPIATEGVLLPKLHEHRCVVSLPDDLHVSKSVRKKGKRFKVSFNEAFDRVVAGCKKQHGRRCWLYPPLVQAFKAINEAENISVMVFDDGINPSGRECPVRLYSLEVWNEATGNLAAGELGYTVGSIYTSLTGFSNEDSAGSVQLAALGRMLCSLGFSLWDLGMEMDYKNSLGCNLMPRKEFVEHVRTVREQKSDLILPSSGQFFNARSIIDQTAQLFPEPQVETDENRQHQPPFDSENSLPDKKKQKNCGSKNAKPVESS